MKHLSMLAVSAAVLLMASPRVHAANDGSAESFQKARAACKQELGSQIGKQSTHTKDEQQMLWKRCMQEHLSSQRK